MYFSLNQIPNFDVCCEEELGIGLFNQQDSAGCAPLHECAARNLSWYVEILFLFCFIFGCKGGATACGCRCRCEPEAWSQWTYATTGLRIDASCDTMISVGMFQMACSLPDPNKETVRAFLDKGAHPNWCDASGRTAFNMAVCKVSVSSRRSPFILRR